MATNAEWALSGRDLGLSPLCGFSLLILTLGFPGGVVVKNLPANVGDTDSIPDPRRFQMPPDN